MKYSEIKQIIEFCEEYAIDRREVINNIISEEEDFNVDDYRFIHQDDIDKIQVDELQSDPYMLGCFNDWFIADISNLSIDIIKALQEAEKYEAIGEYIIDNNLTEELQSEYSRLDGYGHHFAAYDGNTMEDLYNLGYYVFRTN